MDRLNEILKSYCVPIAVISEMEKNYTNMQSKISFLEFCINAGVIEQRKS